MKILLVSSAGGHFNELMLVRKLINPDYQQVVVTEKIKQTANNKHVDYYLKYGTRAHLIKYILVLVFNCFKAFNILWKERPNVIVTTGAHSCVPFLLLSRIFKIKTIYIESFAKTNSTSLTYRLCKKQMDIVLVQHESALAVYDDAVFIGGIY